MQVIKRDGQHEKVSFDKILTRISRLSDGLNKEYVDPVQISIKVIDGLKNKITTAELDNLAAEIAAARMTYHPDFGVLASRIAISNLHKQTSQVFSDVIHELYLHNIIASNIHEIVIEHSQVLNNAIVHSRDFLFTYFGYKTLEKSYLLKINDVIVERPQYMFMRVALEIHRSDITRVLETYHAMSQKYFTHASPTLFNSGMERNQLSSCFLEDIESDSLEGIYNTLKSCAMISKSAGGIGLAIHKIRSKGSYIGGSHGYSSGIVPMLKVFNDTARYVDQAGRRPGAFAIYLEPWHADVFDFLEMKKNTGKEEQRARDLFYAMWIPDLFMKRVESNGSWSLMDPHDCPRLDEVYGEEFEHLYISYEREGKVCKVIEAQKLWQAIIDSQIETGGPYMLYKDSVNRKSNQMNLGTIKSSNLCVAPETKLTIMTNAFMEEVPISLLEGKEVNVWNGKQWSTTKVVKTGEDQELVKITVNINGSLHSLECTEYHKFYSRDGSVRSAVELVPGDLLEKRYDIDTSYPVVHSVEHTGRRDATYCVNEPLRHRAMFNDILTGNCTEITEYTSPDEVAVCNLCSLGLPTYVENGSFNFDKLRQMTKIVTRNLNNVIDRSYYPVQKAYTSNTKHRPIGIGIQGLADVFLLLRYPFDSDEARLLNKQIFETIYYAALEASCELASEQGVYQSYYGSPASKGVLQYDMWNVQPSDLWDWSLLKRKIAVHGLRNSLLVAPMPTASTSQILGFNEAFEPITSNIYNRRVLSGEYQLVNHYLINDLIRLGLWNDSTRQAIIRNDGSVQHITDLPNDIKLLYRTVWEIPQRAILDMAADRGAFIDQSQSMNIFIKDASYSKLSSMHFYGWKKGLKTGSYYIRTQAAYKPVQFTIQPLADDGPVCRKEEGCIVCSS